MTIKEFEKEQAELLKDPEIRQAWLEYLSGFPHVSAYFRTAPQFRNQISIVNGKKAGTDINLYKLFMEQCYNLLRPGGRCGIITPGSIYTDLGAKQLRETLFSECQVDSVFGLSNERYIFEGVDHRQKICILTYSKGGNTEAFEAAFRINPREAVRPEEMEQFLNTPSEHITLNVALIRKLSPESLSVMEFKSPKDVEIAERMSRFPLLGEEIQGGWKFSLTREFDISKGKLLHTKPGRNRLPLLTGRMFNQFTLLNVPPKFWIDESVGRKHLLKDTEDTKARLDYQGYRWVHRRIARASDSRTFISTIVPPMVFTENNSTTIKVASSGMSYPELVYLTALTNSFCLDWMLRLKVDDTLNMFYIYSLPVPRLTNKDRAFCPIVDRAARLICTAPEFDDLAREVGLTGHGDGATDEATRTGLRAELDALVAHLYGLTEEEFAYILTTFPLVDQTVKDATLDAFRRFAPDPTDQQLEAMIARGEGARLEFKVAACWNPATKARDGTLKDNIVQAVAAFLNSREGGALLIGVASDGTVVDLADDFTAANPQRPGRDSYELFLRDLIGNQLGRENGDGYAISFHRVNRREVCRISVAPAPKPVYLNGDFYLRDGNKKSKLKAKEAAEYIRHRWG
jgi:hypothetical protein